jgi:hypothetical protein
MEYKSRALPLDQTVRYDYIKTGLEKKIRVEGCGFSSFWLRIITGAHGELLRSKKAGGIS